MLDGFQGESTVKHSMWSEDTNKDTLLVDIELLSIPLNYTPEISSQYSQGTQQTWDILKQLLSP